MKKIGFIGNSCTGKTTAVLGLIAELKLRKALVGYVTDMARGLPFLPDALDRHPDARLHVLFRQAVAETEQIIRPDADYIVTERTLIDWWIYYRWTCAEVGCGASPALLSLVREWTRGYDLLVFMSGEGMTYVDDGYRPATTRIRDEVEPFYQQEAAMLRDLRPSGTFIEIKGGDVRQRRDEAVDAVLGFLSPLTIRETRR